MLYVTCHKNRTEIKVFKNIFEWRKSIQKTNELFFCLSSVLSFEVQIQRSRPLTLLLLRLSGLQLLHVLHCVEAIIWTFARLSSLTSRSLWSLTSYSSFTTLYIKIFALYRKSYWKISYLLHHVAQEVQRYQVRQAPTKKSNLNFLSFVYFAEWSPLTSGPGGPGGPTRLMPFSPLSPFSPSENFQSPKYGKISVN